MGRRTTGTKQVLAFEDNAEFIEFPDNTALFQLESQGRLNHTGIAEKESRSFTTWKQAA